MKREQNSSRFFENHYILHPAEHRCKLSEESPSVYPEAFVHRDEQLVVDIHRVEFVEVRCGLHDEFVRGTPDISQDSAFIGKKLEFSFINPNEMVKSCRAEIRAVGTGKDFPLIVCDFADRACEGEYLQYARFSSLVEHLCDIQDGHFAYHPGKDYIVVVVLGIFLPKQIVNLRGEMFEINGFFEESVGTDVFRVDLLVIAAVTGHDDKRNILEGFVLFEFAGQIDAVYIRHLEVGDNNIRQKALGDRDPFASVFRYLNLKTAVSQFDTEYFECFRIVIDY